MSIRRLTNWLPLLLVALVVLFCAVEPAVACPTCKDSVEGAGSNMAQGYFWSILFMLSMPFLIFGSLCTYFYLLVRAARTKAASDGVAGVALPAQMVAAK
ncbi:MAG: hypothetical protein RIC55_29160 [Pirellulaceae bacterium]